MAEAFDSKPIQYILVAGNPGVGKSTLMNCFIKSRSVKGGSYIENDMFKSGISFGSGITNSLQCKQIDEFFIMDTPGLSDVKLRKEAAEAITKGLKQDGEYKIIFVVTLEAGRIHPDDITTMFLVLKSIRTISHYGVIFNKLSRKFYKHLSDETKVELVSQLSLSNHSSSPIPFPLFLENVTELEEEDDAITRIDQLNEFLAELPTVKISIDDVTPVPYECYEDIREKVQNDLEALNKDNMKMKSKIEKDRNNYQQQLQKIMENEKEKYEIQNRKQREENEKELKAIEEKIQELEKKKLDSNRNDVLTKQERHQYLVTKDNWTKPLGNQKQYHSKSFGVHKNCYQFPKDASKQPYSNVPRCIVSHVDKRTQNYEEEIKRLQNQLALERSKRKKIQTYNESLLQNPVVKFVSFFFSPR